MRNLSLIFTFLCLGIFGTAQSQVVDIDPLASGQYEHQVTGLPSYSSPQFYTYFWWFGDGNYSFADVPRQEYYQINQQSAFNPIGKVMVTGNYGSGGRPPLSVKPSNQGVTISATNPDMPETFGGVSGLRLQHFNSIVPEDLVYFLVTYSSHDTVSGISGQVKLTINDPDVAVLLTRNNADNFVPGFVPFGEDFTGASTPGTFIYQFAELDSAEERSFVIALSADQNLNEYIGREVPIEASIVFENGSVPAPDPDEINLMVNASHDPNTMYPSIQNAADCAIGGDTIHYKTRFQNTGNKETKYVRLEIDLDQNLDLNSLTNFQFHTPMTQNSTFYNARSPNITAQTWATKLDRANSKLYIEFQNMFLLGLSDSTCPDVELTKGWVEYDIKVNDGYVIGDDIVCQGQIIFDGNAPMPTNEAITTCGDKKPKLFVTPVVVPTMFADCCWLVILLLIIVLLLLILWLRERRKRKQGSKK